MATIAEFTVSAEDDPFAAVFEALPEATVELERIVPTSASAFPYFWVRGADVSRVESLLDDHHAMLSVELSTSWRTPPRSESRGTTVRRVSSGASPRLT